MFGILLAMSCLQHGQVRGSVEFLGEISDPEPGPFANGSVVRRILADDHPEQGGFPRAVSTDEADPGFRTEMGRRLGKKAFSSGTVWSKIQCGSSFNPVHSKYRLGLQNREKKYGKARWDPTTTRSWWSWPGLNRRPRECHSRALPTAPQPHSEVFSEKNRQQAKQR